MFLLLLGHLHRVVERLQLAPGVARRFPDNEVELHDVDLGETGLLHGSAVQVVAEGQLERLESPSAGPMDGLHGHFRRDVEDLEHAVALGELGYRMHQVRSLAGSADAAF